MITKKELKKLRDSLPNDKIKLLAASTGFSESYVHQVLYGRANKMNIQIIEAAIELAKATKARLEASKAEIASI